MSQTPTATPSRRRPLPDTPGSARSTTSTTDRSTLVDRVEELSLEVHDLRRRIAAERQRRRPISAPTLSLTYLDPSGRSAVELQQLLAEKLAQMDDDALTALLTASQGGLSKMLRGGEMAMDPALIPAKTVGVEATGSASEVDRRLAQKGLQEQISAARHAASINGWLKDRQRRLTALVEALGVFSLLDVDSLTASGDEAGGSRRVRIQGSMARLFAVDVRFDVQDEGESPRVQRLQLNLPAWLATTLDTPHRLYTKLQARNDLPALLLMLRTMIPLVALRRNLFSSLLETYTHLARDHVRAWESLHGVDFTPYHPPSSTPTPARRASAKHVDEALAKSLIVDDAAEGFKLTNKRGASLELRFAIRWNRFGHAYPDISAVPNVPTGLTDATSRAFLTGFAEEFQHLLKVAVAQNAIIGLPDHDAEQDEELDPTVGRWGIAAAIHATIKAFFGLEQDEGSSMEQE